MIFKRALLSLLTFLLFFSYSTIFAQGLKNIRSVSNSGLATDEVMLSDSTSIVLTSPRPLFSFLINDKLFNSNDVKAVKDNGGYSQLYNMNISVLYSISEYSGRGMEGSISFQNTGTDTVSLSNILPFGENGSSYYITGHGPDDLARACLFRPGLKPLRVILPDNAWELGYSSFNTGKGFSICGLARRTGNQGALVHRYETVLPPGAKVIYSLYADVFNGEWQNGLKMMFSERYLYDLDKFDETLFNRPDLEWIRKSYLIVLQMAWDRDFYDRFTGKYTYPEIIRKGIELFGHIDVFGLWTTWPRLGLDDRNQWDLYGDLPGGIDQLRSFIKMSQQSGTKFFIAYNPWDNIAGEEDRYSGLTQLLTDTEADGVILDTRGSSSVELQAAVDSAGKGVVLYSEGMAVPKDMPGIVSGRVHNAIYLSPELNLNKLIKPDFSIFRVCDVGEDIIHREIAIAFFNGYGIELNMFRPGGRNENLNTDLDFLSHTTFILRQNNKAFLDMSWTPLIPTTLDNVYVNRWVSGNKTLYTVLNMKEEGVEANLFKVNPAEGKHFISLWNHQNILPITSDGDTYVPVSADGWASAVSGTRKEGSVNCIAEFPEILRTRLFGDSIYVSHKGTGKIVIWKGDPSYQTQSVELEIVRDTTLRIEDVFGNMEGKIVVQLLDNDNNLEDENVLFLTGGIPWKISKVVVSERATEIPPEMVLIPGSSFSYNVIGNDDFIPYPLINGDTITLDSFLIDRYPVTNEEYYEFMINSGYRPADTSRFLRHWRNGIFKQGQDKYPVVYVSYEDVMAYADWAGKRLLTQEEWQYAAQGSDGRLWPWGDDFHGTYCNDSFERPTPVDAFSKGQSPFGVIDMIGNVWQLTGDIYYNGSNYFEIIRGGSYYKAGSSWWYMPGGPQSLDKTQMLLMVSPGFDRSPTVGFRCAKDIDNDEFKVRRQR